MADLYTLISDFESFGGFDILLPFLLIYAVTLGLLSSVAPWGRQGKGLINKLISLAVSLYVVAFTPYGMSMGAYLTGLLGGAGVYIVGLLVLLLLIGMFGVSLKDVSSLFGKKLLLLLVLLAAAGVWYYTGPGLQAGFRMTDDLWAVAVTGLIALLVIWMVRAGGEEKPAPSPEKPPEAPPAQPPRRPAGPPEPPEEKEEEKGERGPVLEFASEEAEEEPKGFTPLSKEGANKALTDSGLGETHAFLKNAFMEAATKGDVAAFDNAVISFAKTLDSFEARDALLGDFATLAKNTGEHGLRYKVD